MGDDLTKPSKETKINRMNSMIMATVIGFIGAFVALMAQFKEKEKELGCYPNKNYDYLELIGEIVAFIGVILGIYFFYASYVDYKEGKTMDLRIFMIANAVALLAVALEAYGVFNTENLENINLEPIIF